MLPTEEYVEVEGRQYVNPQTGLDAANSFIDRLRETQSLQNQEITQQTRNLGTDIPSNLGGLVGGEGYFTSRYQTPQTNSVVANLRATAQAQALNQALENEQAIWKNRYQQAYRNYRKRQAASGGGGGGASSQTPAGEGDVTTTVTGDELEARGGLNISGSDISRGGHYIVSQDINRYGGHDIIWVASNGRNVTIPQLSNGSYATAEATEFARAHGASKLPFFGGR